MVTRRDHLAGLAPARDLAEALAIPVEMASEQLAGLWRVRGMRMFVEALRENPRRTVSVADMVETRNAIPTSR